MVLFQVVGVTHFKEHLGELKIMENITNLSTIDIRAVIWDNYIKDKFKKAINDVQEDIKISDKSESKEEKK